MYIFLTRETHFTKVPLHTLEMKFPMPAYRTLNKRVEDLKFKPGIQFEILDMLVMKLQHLPPSAKLAVLKVT